MDRLTRNAPLALLGVALAAAAAMTLYLTREMTFFGDSWDYLIDRRAVTLDNLMRPHAEHISVIPVAISQLFLRLFGMSSPRPEYILLTVMLLVAASLLFVYVRRRVGPWLALLAAVALLTLGPAWEVLLWPFEISFVGSALFGIAMFLALDRDDPVSDGAACAFLILSFGFSSLGIPFAVAAAVDVWQKRRLRGLGRAYLVVVPVILYAAWFAGWGHEAESHLSVHNVLGSPRFVLESMAVAAGSLLGLGTNYIAGESISLWAPATLIALVALVGYRFARRSPLAVPRSLWPVVAAAFADWFLTALNVMVGRAPFSSRYQYAGVLFLIMALANLLRGERFSTRFVAIAAMVMGAAVVSNLGVLRDGKQHLQQETVFTRADLAAVEIAHRTVSPGFVLDPEIAGTPSLLNVVAGKYLQAVDEYGSPAYTPSELSSAPEEGRRQADIVLAKALPISTVTTLGGGGAPRPPGARCVPLEGTGSPQGVPLPAGRASVLVPAGPEAQLSLRRFAVGEFPVTAESAPGNSVTVLRIPRDDLSRPWYLRVEARQGARVCG